MDALTLEEKIKTRENLQLSETDILYFSTLFTKDIDIALRKITPEVVEEYAKLKGISERIIYLSKLNIFPGIIGRIMGKRYQHINNVLDRAEKVKAGKAELTREPIKPAKKTRPEDDVHMDFS